MDNYIIISAPQRCTETGKPLLFDQRKKELDRLVQQHLDREQAHSRRLVYSKTFLSDAQNQAPQYEDLLAAVEQPPLDGCKIATLLKTTDATSNVMLHTLRLTEEEAAGRDSYEQTRMLFDKYLEIITPLGLTLSQHCVRTWIYVSDIDTNYAGVVHARNDVFAQHGLTRDTHYIASTGIGGRTGVRSARVAIDFLTYPDIQESDKQYLQALDHLNPTHEYGVAFERGTMVTEPDGTRRYFISGTASIDCHGKILNEGDVEKQTERLLENIDALLHDGGAAIADMRYFIVYLRDPSDRQIVDEYMEQRFPDVPRIILIAPVCRPGWLVEMEGVAVR